MLVAQASCANEAPSEMSLLVEQDSHWLLGRTVPIGAVSIRLSFSQGLSETFGFLCGFLLAQAVGPETLRVSAPDKGLGRWSLR